MLSSLKNPAVTYLLITLIPEPLVSPGFWAVVEWFLDVSKSLKTQSANVRVLSRQQLQSLGHTMGPSHSPISLTLSFWCFFGVLMILYSSSTPGPFSFLRVWRCCSHGLHHQCTCALDNRKFDFPSIHSLPNSEGLVIQYVSKVTNVHMQLLSG